MAQKIQVETGWDRSMRSCAGCGCMTVILGPVALFLLALWGGSIAYDQAEQRPPRPVPAAHQPDPTDQPHEPEQTENQETVDDDRPRPNEQRPVVFDDSPLRTWTSADGQFTTEAALVQYDAAARTAAIQTADGQRIELAIEQLSLDDRNYIRGRARE